MKKSYLILLFLLFISLRGFSQCEQTVWEDNFTGTALNTGLWAYDIGDGSGTPAGAGWGNAELQNYTNNATNVKVENGNLIITAAYSGGTYTSAKIKTTASVNGFVKFGRIEARMKLPSATGVWPAFWMLPKSGAWPDGGEIDILESKHTNPSKSQSTIHYAYPSGTHQQTTGILATTDLSADFHVYAMEWSENQIHFFFDDQLYLTVNPEVTMGNAWPFNGEFYIILNVAVGGPNTPFTEKIPPVPTEYPASLVVDYVRVKSGPWSTSINGDTKAYQNSIKTYSIVSLTDATYNWTVPQGAIIQSGQGTNSINVKFDNTLTDNITCTLTNSCGTNEYKKSITVEKAFEAKMIYEDFEANRNVTYGAPTGTLTQVVDNPDPGGANTSSKVGKYIRNSTELYDVIPLKNVSVDKAGLYVTQQRRIHLDIYTTAPVGTKVRIQFETNAVSTPINYPYGRHSVYDAFTTKQDAWETLEFNYVNSPDINLISSDIDLFTLLIDPGNTTDYTIWFDNLIFGQPGPDPVYSISNVFEDYDGHSQMIKSTSDGVYSVVANPLSDAINSSANCLKYIRNQDETYDVLSFNQLQGLPDASQYKKGTNVFFVDIKTNAPVGTPIIIQLENSGMSTPGNYPVGRNSKYNGVTSKQNEWETIQFSFEAIIDVGTPDVAVDQFVLLLDAGNNSGNMYFIDNIHAGTSNTVPVNWVLDDVYENFDGTSFLTYASSNGTYAGLVVNPFPGGINPSAQVGEYIRNANSVYDALFFENLAITDANVFRKGEKRFALDVYTDIPAGTLVNVQMEDKSTSTPDNFPTGRHSYYQGVVKKSNEWHTIDFLYTASPDPSVTNENVNTTTFLFAPNSSMADTVYFDNFRSYKKVIDPNAPQLSISVTSLTVASAANSAKTFNITSSNTIWSIGRDKDWLTFSSSSGSDSTGNAIITLTAAENILAKTRTAVITVSATGLPDQKITVTQEAAIDIEAPAAFTTTKGIVTVSSIELLLNATDNSGSLTFTISYDGKIRNVNALSGTQTSVIISGLTSGTEYSFMVEAKDATGNVAVNNPLTVNAITLADTESPTAFTATKGVVAANSVELLLNATDNSGVIIYTITYGSTNLTVNGTSRQQVSYNITGLSGATSYSFSIIAKDAAGNISANSPVVVTAATGVTSIGDECSGTAFESAEGAAFVLGYKYSFVTIGNDDVVSFELLDSKVGLVAFLFNRTNGFKETQMTNVSGSLFTITLPNQTQGAILTLACKFAWAAGGFAVTRDFNYTVGNNCITSTPTSENTAIRIYPNPAENTLFLDGFVKIANVTVFDLSGKIVINKHKPDKHVDISNLEKGLYMVKITDQNRIVNKKFVKQ